MPQAHSNGTPTQLCTAAVSDRRILSCVQVRPGRAWLCCRRYACQQWKVRTQAAAASYSNWQCRAVSTFRVLATVASSAAGSTPVIAELRCCLLFLRSAVGEQRLPLVPSMLDNTSSWCHMVRRFRVVYRLANQVYVMGVAPAHGNVLFASRVVNAATHHLVVVNRGISVTPDRIANRFPEVRIATSDTRGHKASHAVRACPLVQYDHALS